jgi:hypothetical protein
MCELRLQFTAGDAMAHEEHLAILRSGVQRWNERRRANQEIQPHLSDADLGGTPLIDANLRRADLRRANLSWAVLTGANLSEADLSWPVVMATLHDLWSTIHSSLAPALAQASRLLGDEPIPPHCFLGHSCIFHQWVTPILSGRQTWVRRGVNYLSRSAMPRDWPLPVGAPR